MNKVLLAGRLTRDPEMRALASGKHVTQFSVATTEYAGNGKERPEFHNVVTWDRLAEVCGRYLGKGQQVAIEGRIQTRTWDDDKGLRHWKTEIVAIDGRDAVRSQEEGLRGRVRGRRHRGEPPRAELQATLPRRRAGRARRRARSPEELAA